MSGDPVRIWLIDAAQPDAVVAGLAALLGVDERARVATMRRDTDRRRFTVAHGALRMIAGDALGVPAADLRWRHGPHGKPELDGVHTNLSHSGDLNAVAITPHRPVGVDVQRLIRTAPAMAGRYFPAAEAEFVAGGRDDEERAYRFARLWARKEACVKAAGGRLAEGLPMLVGEGDAVVGPPDEPFRVTDLDVDTGFCGSVALRGAAPYTVETLRWRP